MNNLSRIFLPTLIILLLMGKTPSTAQTLKAQDAAEIEIIESDDFKDCYGERVFPPNVDYTIDISHKSLAELRFLRNTPYARHNYLFMDAVIRSYFDGEKWYQPFHWIKNYTVELSAVELQFIQRVKKRELELLQQNYEMRNGRKMARFENIVNLNNGHLPTQDSLDNSHLNAHSLRENGFVVVPSNEEQMFHIYDKSNYTTTPNFVTTDVVLQLFHLYFDNALRIIEEQNFRNSLQKIVSGLHAANKKLLTSQDSLLKKTAEYNTAYYAVALSILTEKKQFVPKKYQKNVAAELKQISAHNSARKSIFLGEELFDYSLFTPRGHYTRSKKSEQYFKAMMWLQTAPFHIQSLEEVARIALSASQLHGIKSGMQTLADMQRRMVETTTFLVGEPNRTSILVVADILQARNYPANESELLVNERLVSLQNELQSLPAPRIQRKGAMTEQPSVRFATQFYTPDAEILSRMTEITRNNPLRPFPKGLDVFAGFGVKTAENILLNEEKETEQWPAFADTLHAVQRDFTMYKNWDKTTYNKWIQSLTSLFVEHEEYPYFMHTDAWQRKNLNTALASWTELKHNTILYAEQPNSAEGGNGCEAPPPVVVGYVEPNIEFWKKCTELVALTRKVFEPYRSIKATTVYHPSTDEGMEGVQPASPHEGSTLFAKLDGIDSLITFCRKMSEKELAGKKLTDSEYNRIHWIGGEIERLTLTILDVEDWSSVRGPNESMAVVADVYTNGNSLQCLEEAVGNAQVLYVVVEIDGLLYLTKGAVFSYYEFKQPTSERLTDESWQKVLSEGKQPPLPLWMNSILHTTKESNSKR